MLGLHEYKRSSEDCVSEKSEIENHCLKDESFNWDQKKVGIVKVG